MGQQVATTNESGIDGFPLKLDRFNQCWAEHDVLTMVQVANGDTAARKKTILQKRGTGGGGWPEHCIALARRCGDDE